MKITTVACLHSKLELIQILLAAIIDFGGSHFVFVCGLIDEIIVPSYFFPPKAMTRRQNNDCNMYTFGSKLELIQGCLRPLWIFA